MFFHYGNCKDDVDRLNKEIDFLRARKKEAQEQAELYKGEMKKKTDLISNLINAHCLGIKGHESELEKKDKEYHERFEKVNDERQMALIKLNNLEAAYTRIGLELGEAKHTIEELETINAEWAKQTEDLKIELDFIKSSSVDIYKETTARMNEIRKENEELKKAENGTKRRKPNNSRQVPA